MEVQTSSYCNYPEYQRRSKERKHLRCRNFFITFECISILYVSGGIARGVQPVTQASKIESFLTIANSLNPLTIVVKLSISDNCGGLCYVSEHDCSSFLGNKYQALHEKCPYSEFFQSAFSCIRTEFREIFRISLYSDRMRENTDLKNFEYGLFSRSEALYKA